MPNFVQFYFTKRFNSFKSLIEREFCFIELHLRICQQHTSIIHQIWTATITTRKKIIINLTEIKYFSCSTTSTTTTNVVCNRCYNNILLVFAAAAVVVLVVMNVVVIVGIKNNNKPKWTIWYLQLFIKYFHSIFIYRIFEWLFISSWGFC